MDYGNNFLSGLIVSTHAPFQSVLNTAAGLTLLKHKAGHVSPLISCLPMSLTVKLKSLQWTIWSWAPREISDFVFCVHSPLFSGFYPAMISSSLFLTQCLCICCPLCPFSPRCSLPRDTYMTCFSIFPNFTQTPHVCVATSLPLPTFSSFFFVALITLSMFHLFLFVLAIVGLLTVLEYKLQENSDFCLFYCILIT